MRPIVCHPRGRGPPLRRARPSRSSPPTPRPFRGLQDAQFKGRQVVTFHNQRDFIFFRQHRYIFSEDGKSARLQELGPRFTLKLKWLLVGPFEPTTGEYEWIHKRHDMDSSRRRFHL